MAYSTDLPDIKNGIQSGKTEYKLTDTEGVKKLRSEAVYNVSSGVTIYLENDIQLNE